MGDMRNSVKFQYSVASTLARNAKKRFGNFPFLAI